MSAELDSLYQEIILDHYKHPHHKGLREPFESEVHHVNPTCGDEVTLRVKVAEAITSGPAACARSPNVAASSSLVSLCCSWHSSSHAHHRDHTRSGEDHDVTGTGPGHRLQGRVAGGPPAGPFAETDAAMWRKAVGTG